MNQHRGISGWAGAYACHIDEVLPGFLGELQRAYPGRRQIVFASLSKMGKTCFDDGKETVELGRWLKTAKGREIIAKTFGSDPKGYRKALGRCGFSAKPKSFYADLHTIYSDESQQSLSRILRFRNNIQPSDLAKLKKLDVQAQTLPVLEKLDSVDDAEQLQIEIELVRKICPNLNDKALRKSLVSHAKQDKLECFIDDWISKVEVFPDPPVAGTNRLLPLRSGQDICRAAKKFRNCLEDYITNVIAGMSYFYEWKDRNRAIVEIRNDQPMGWRISEVNGLRNQKVSTTTLDEIEAYFARHGIIRRPSWKHNLYIVGGD